ncbi:hypothetical protein [Singulisphaera sp. PoT]|uniref:hypothetical protein n=1 Tax=Singulisphaera sp. PoT TaxID=3411797 RepID=UPI003BF4CF20
MIGVGRARLARSAPQLTLCGFHHAEPLHRVLRFFRAGRDLIQFVCETWREEDAGHCPYRRSPDSGIDGAIVARAAYDIKRCAYLKMIGTEPLAVRGSDEGIVPLPGPFARDAVLFLLGGRVLRFSSERWREPELASCRCPYFLDAPRGFAMTVQAEWLATGRVIPDVSSCEEFRRVVRGCPASSPQRAAGV